jgi:uncharacterized protein (DUF427 family)
VIPESGPDSAQDRDYPQMAAERGRVEPAPRRVRGYVDGVLVFDTVAARYVWEVPYYPQYYVPMKDVRTQYLVDEDHAQRVQFGASRSHALNVNGVTIAEAARVFGDDAIPGVADTARFTWDAIDWFEEDERIVGGHPRNPYARVDALRSSRTVRVELDGIVLAQSSAPVLVFETGLPTRSYFDRKAVDFGHLRPSDTQTACPYKGRTSDYWSIEIGGQLYRDLAWSYAFPTLPLLPIAGLVAFYDEKVDVYVDDRLQERPKTHFFRE